MSAPVDDGALRAELEAVREASRAGEIVAAHRDDERSMARYVAGATARLVLFTVVIAAIGIAVALFTR